MRRPEIAIFVDVQNIYYTTRQMYQRSFNYRKLYKYYAQQGEIVIANAYAIESTDDRQIKFQDALTHMGFTVKRKPFIQRRDGSAKGDWDVGITIDMLELAEKADTVVLLSGDGDFDLLLQRLHQKHKLNIEVFGVPNLTAKSLMNAADSYHAITNEWLM